MKFNRILLSLVLSLSAGFANASDDAASLYATYEQKLSSNDLNGAYEALAQRRETDKDNLQYIYDEASFLMEYSDDKSDAFALLEEALKTAEKKQDKYWLPRLNELKAGALFFLGDYEEAYETGRKALSFFKGDEKDEELSDISQLMVGICTALNRHDEAVKYGLQSLDIRRTTAGENSQKVASSLSALSLSYLRSGDIEKAEDAIGESEKIYEKLGIEEPSFFQNKASIAFEKKDYASAQKLFSKALELSENQSGNASTVISVLKSLSVCAQRQNNTDEASSYIEKAVSVASSAYGKEHPAMASVLNEKGLFEHSSGQYAKAMDTFADALGIYDKAYGERSQQSHDVLLSMYRCACDIVVNDDAAIKKAKDFMSDKFFTLETEDSSPVFLLAFGEWKMNSAACLFDYIPTVIDNNVDVLLSSDGSTVQKVQSSQLGTFNVSMQRDKARHDELLKLME